MIKNLILSKKLKNLRILQKNKNHFLKKYRILAERLSRKSEKELEDKV